MQFHPLQNRDEYERLMALQQTSKVAEYRENFEALSVTSNGGGTHQGIQEWVAGGDTS